MSHLDLYRLASSPSRGARSAGRLSRSRPDRLRGVARADRLPSCDDARVQVTLTHLGEERRRVEVARGLAMIVLGFDTADPSHGRGSVAWPMEPSCKPATIPRQEGGPGMPLGCCRLPTSSCRSRPWLGRWNGSLSGSVRARSQACASGSPLREALAQSLGVELVGVSSLRALAYGTGEARGTCPLVAGQRVGRDRCAPR